MNYSTIKVIAAVLLVLAGMGGLYVGIAYSGWVLAVGLLGVCLS